MTDRPVVHYYVHGRGRGHATRSLQVIEALRARGAFVRVFAGQDARPVIGDGCTPVVSIPTGLPLGLPRLLVRRVRQARASARGERAKVIVSDGDMPAMVAGRLSGLTTIAVGHGLVFGHCRRPPGSPRLPWLREGIKARLASLGATHRIAVNFVPLPACDPRRTTVAGPAFLSPLTGARGGLPAGPVLCYFRDGDGARIARWVAEIGHEVVLFGGAPQAPGVRCEPFTRDGFAARLPHARAVISSAGSQLISECLFHGVPQLALYHARDDEQRLNGWMLTLARQRSQGCAMDGCTPGRLRAFLDGLPNGPAESGFGSEVRAALPEPDVVQAVLSLVAGAALGGIEAARTTS